MSKSSRVFAYNGFTLIELSLVVAILGLLAAIVIPLYPRLTGDAARTAFVRDLRTYISAAELFQIKDGQYPESSEPGQVPVGWEKYIVLHEWTRNTPIGGQWYIARDSYGVQMAIGVYFLGDARSDDYMQKIDAALDDGDLSTGSFRKVDGNRYFYIISD